MILLIKGADGRSKDSTQAGRTGGCFSGNSTVTTPSGPRKISEIKHGDKILSVDSGGHQVFSDVLLFLDRNKTDTREFYQLQTTSGKSIVLTPSHLIYTVQPESLTMDEQYIFHSNSYLILNETGRIFLSKSEITFARNVQIGDFVLVSSSNDSLFDIDRVVDMSVRIETGVYAPLTTEGNLIVDGVLSSCYAIIDDQSLDHWAFLPVRLTHNLIKGVKYIWTKFSRIITFRNDDIPLINSNSNQYDTPNESDNEQGVHWYAEALYTISKYIIPSNLQYDA